MLWLKSLLPFPADSFITVGHLRGNWNKTRLPWLCCTRAIPLQRSSEPASMNTQRASVSGQASPPCRHSPVPLFLSWALLVLASEWQCLALTSCLLNKITSAKRKKECPEKRTLLGHMEKREARLSDSKTFLCRKDSWVCSGDGNSGWPTETKSRNHSFGFYDCLSLALGGIFGLSFSQHTPCLAVRNTKVLRSQQANLSQVAYGVPGKKMNLPGQQVRCYECFHFALETMMNALWGRTGEWVQLEWGIRLLWRNTTESILQRW